MAEQLYKRIEELAAENAKLRLENLGLRSALEQISGYYNMTKLHDCCVEKTCTPIFEGGKKVGHCAFGFGVNRGFNECAGIARAALGGGE